MKNKKLCILLFLGLGLMGSSQSLFAQAGTSGAGILLQEVSARLTALGGTGIAWQNSADVLLANPAGLRNLGHNEIIASHVAGIESMTTEMLVAALPVTELGTVGLQVLYRSAPPIDNEGAGDAAVDMKDIVMGLGIGIPLTDQLSLGVQGKGVLLYLGPVDAADLAFDFGAQYQLNDHWRLALALRNIGPSVEWNQGDDPLPLTLAAGVHVLLYRQDKLDWQAALETHYLSPDQIGSVHVGSELTMDKKIVLRLGLKVATETTAAYGAAGLGLRFKLFRTNMALDFTFSPEFWGHDNLSLKNLFSLSAWF